MKFEINEHNRLTMNEDIFNREHYFWSYIFLVVETNAHATNYKTMYPSEISSTNILLGGVFLEVLSDLIPCEECSQNLLGHLDDLKKTKYNVESLSVKEQYELLSELFYRSGASRRKGKNLRASIEKFVREFIGKEHDPYYNPIALAFIEFLWQREYDEKEIARILNYQAAHKQTRFTTYGEYIKRYNQVVPGQVLPFDQGSQEAFDDLYAFSSLED